MGSSYASARRPWINILVHGTQPLPDKINPMYCKDGIHPITDIHSKNNRYRDIFRELSDVNSDLFPFEHAYTGGWSGQLNFKVRKEAAQDYLNQIRTLIGEYQKKYGSAPRIRIITHSHGGNVVLNMADFYAEDQPVVIDELILLGCPVQQVTVSYATHAMFDKVYVLSSPTDLIQIADMQGMPEVKNRIGSFVDKPSWLAFKNIFKKMDDPLFSEREFPKHKKIKQAYVRSGSRGLFHVEWLMLHIMKKLPDIIRHLEDHQEDTVVACDINKL